MPRLDSGSHTDALPQDQELTAEASPITSSSRSTHDLFSHGADRTPILQPIDMDLHAALQRVHTEPRAEPFAAEALASGSVAPRTHSI